MNKINAAIFTLVFCNLAWAQNPTTECLAQLKEDAKLQILWEKLPFDVTRGQSLEVLANKTKPTMKEKAALSFFTSESERCVDLGAEWRQQNFDPAVISLFATYRVEIVSALADLYAGKTTYGDFGKFRAKQTADLKNNVDAVSRSLRTQQAANDKQRQEAVAQQNEAGRQAQEQRVAIELQQQFARQQAEEQQEEARRQASLQYLRNQKPYQVPLYQMPIQRTQTTNCTALGNQMNCTTR